MKLLIDIPEHIYEHAKETTEDSRDEFDAMRAIANGTQQESRSEIPNTCGDAISRQAAKRALEDRFMELQKRHNDKRYETNYCLNTILELPSVSPHPQQVLDKIRAEIMDFEEELFHRPNTDYTDYAAVRHCVEIVDKYKAESEDKE